MGRRISILPINLSSPVNYFECVFCFQGVVMSYEKVVLPSDINVTDIGLLCNAEEKQETKFELKFLCNLIFTPTNSVPCHST